MDQMPAVDAGGCRDFAQKRTRAEQVTWPNTLLSQRDRPLSLLCQPICLPFAPLGRLLLQARDGGDSLAASTMTTALPQLSLGTISLNRSHVTGPRRGANPTLSQKRLGGEALTVFVTGRVQLQGSVSDCGQPVPVAVVGPFAWLPGENRIS